MSIQVILLHTDPQHFQLSLFPPGMSGRAKQQMPDTVTHQAKGKLPVHKTSPNLVKPCPKSSCFSDSLHQNLLFQRSHPAHSVLGHFSSTAVHCLLVIIIIKITLQAWLWNTKPRCYKLEEDRWPVTVLISLTGNQVEFCSYTTTMHKCFLSDPHFWTHFGQPQPVLSHKPRSKSPNLASSGRAWL